MMLAPEYAIRMTPLNSEENKELTNVLVRLRILPRTGQLTIHANDTRTAGFQVSTGIIKK